MSWNHVTRPHFYQTRSAWSVDQGSNKNHSPAYNFAPTVTKFCVMWEGLSLPHDTKFGNCRCKIVDSRSFPSWSLIHGLRWSGLIKVGPEELYDQSFSSGNLKAHCPIIYQWLSARLQYLQCILCEIHKKNSGIDFHSCLNVLRFIWQYNWKLVYIPSFISLLSNFRQYSQQLLQYTNSI